MSGAPFPTSASLWRTLQEVQVSFVLGAQARLEHRAVPAGLVGREAPLPCPALLSLVLLAQPRALCCEDTLLAPAQLWVQQQAQGLSCRAASQPAGPQPVLPPGQEFALPCQPARDSSWPVAPSERQLIHLEAQTPLPISPVHLCPCTGGSVPSSRPLIKLLAIASKEIPWKERIRAGTAASRFSPELKCCVIKKCQKLVNILKTFMVESMGFAILNAQCIASASQGLRMKQENQ